MTSPAPSDPKRSRARELAQTHVAQGDAVGWFEPLYAEAEGDPARVPWADLKPNPNLVDWCEREAVRGEGRTALVVGCGLGDDAEFLATRGFQVTAFDIAPSAISWCQRRYPASSARYLAIDLLNPPAAWTHNFDFVFEAYTLQVLQSAALRSQAMERLSAFPAFGGTLLVICRGREPGDPEGQMPWPLLREELAALDRSGLVPAGFEDFLDQHEAPPVRRFRAVWRRPANPATPAKKP